MIMNWKNNWKEGVTPEFQILSQHFSTVNVESLTNVTQDSRFLRRDLKSSFPVYATEWQALDCDVSPFYVGKTFSEKYILFIPDTLSPVSTSRACNLTALFYPVLRLRMCRAVYPLSHMTSCFVLVIYLLTYLLTPWCRVLLEKLTGLQLVKKFSAFHGTRRFISALTSVRHLSLSWASPIQSIYPHPTSWRSILILSTHLRLGLPSALFPSGFPIKTPTTPLSSPKRATCPAHLILLDFINRF